MPGRIYVQWQVDSAVVIECTQASWQPNGVPLPGGDLSHQEEAQVLWKNAPNAIRNTE